MKNYRLLAWLLASLVAGVLWGIYQRSSIQGEIVGGMLFLLLMAYDQWKGVKNDTYLDNNRDLTFLIACLVGGVLIGIYRGSLSKGVSLASCFY